VEIGLIGQVEILQEMNATGFSVAFLFENCLWGVAIKRFYGIIKNDLT
jgi:hypothetical protein